VIDVLKGFVRSSLDALLYETFTGLRSATVYSLFVVINLESWTAMMVRAFRKDLEFQRAFVRKERTGMGRAGTKRKPFM